MNAISSRTRSPESRFSRSLTSCAFITNLWKNYPTRQELTQQVTRRIFQDGNVFIVNSYTDQIFMDKNGRMSTMMQRNSLTWVTTGGRWLIVDVHNSGMPGAPYTP